MKNRVLIIENDPSIQDVVSYILENEGYSVSSTPHTSADDLRRYQADLILLDEWINQKEGHMLCKEIKAIESLKHIPVIIFSTAANIIDIVKNCNADGFVNKPFDMNVLIAEVNKHLPVAASSKLTHIF